MYTAPLLVWVKLKKLTKHANIDIMNDAKYCSSSLKIFIEYIYKCNKNYTNLYQVSKNWSQNMQIKTT
jgi:hypothetical protein